MTVLDRLLGRRTPAPASRVDPCQGDPLAHEWRDRLARGEWTELGAFLRSFDDVETRDFYVGVLADTLTGRPSWLDAWVGREPEAALPRLFRGCHGASWAWDARGGGSASTVRDEGWQRFFERLHGAEDDLLAATRLDPSDAGPWVALLRVTLGLQRGMERQREVFAEAQCRRPWHQAAHFTFLQCLAAKWGGSDELMFAFARETHERAPEGLGVHTVLAQAHIEAWLNGQRGQGYWERPEVREEIVAADERYLHSPRFVPTPRVVANRNTFAFCYWMLKDRDRLREQMEAIGETVTWPWTLFPTKARLIFESAQRTARR